jgi:plastocyanin
MNRTLLVAAGALCLIGGAGLLPALASSPTHPARAAGEMSMQMGDGAGVAGAPASTAKNTITIKNMKYSGSLSVKAGTKVTVVNHDAVPHTLTSKTKGKFTTATINAGESATFTAPKTAGKYPFGCNFHPSMAGTLTVTK